MVCSHVLDKDSERLTVGDGDEDPQHGVPIEQEDVLGVGCGGRPDVLNLIPERQEVVVKEDHETSGCRYVSVYGRTSFIGRHGTDRSCTSLRSIRERCSPTLRVPCPLWGILTGILRAVLRGSDSAGGREGTEPQA